MNRRLALSISLGALLTGRVALAQEEVTIGYQGLPYKSSGESNTGIQVAEGVLLHAGVGVEAGYDTNVLYAETNPQGSALIRVMPFLDLTNATRNGPASKTLTFDIRGGLLYRHYFSDAQDIQPFNNAYNPNAGVSLSLGGSSGRLRDCGRLRSNRGSSISGADRGRGAGAQQQPGVGRGSLVAGRRAPDRHPSLHEHGRRLRRAAYSYANAMTNTLMLDVSWKWLPKTAVFVNVQQGYIFYFNDQIAVTQPGRGEMMGKSSSYPLFATAGLRGLLTEKTSAVLTLGYVNAFYSNGASTDGFLGSTYADLAFTVRPTQLSRFVVGARHTTS